MMKRMCCLMAVLALTGSASAANIVWNRDAQTSASFSMPTDNFSTALIITTDLSTTSLHDANVVTFGNFSTTSIMVYGSSNGLGVRHGGWWANNQPGTVSGQHSVVLTFTKQSDGTYKIATYFDGVQDTHTTHDANLASTSENMSLTFAENATYWTYEGFAVYDSVLTTDEMNTLQTTRDVKSIVPEPSFLALLALGAGALALRRKAKCA